MPALTLLSATAEVRDYLSEDSPALYTDVKIRDQLNRSSASIALERALFPKRTTFSVLADVASTSAPTDMAGWGRGRLRLGNGVLTRIAPDEILERSPMAYSATAEQGTPDSVYWDETGELGAPGQIYLYPRPAAALSLNLSYLSRPADLVSSTDLIWGGRFPEWHDIVTFHATHQLYARQGSKAAEQAIFGKRYFERLNEFARYVALNASAIPKQMVSTLGKRRF